MKRVIERVALIGLGEMGLPMARNLVKAGFQVAGYDVRTERGQMLAQSGGRAVRSTREAAAEVEAAVLIPFTADQLREALLAPNGALAGLPTGGLVVAMSTVGPKAMRELASATLEQGYQFLDAPVTGGAARAETGTLTVIASGTSETLERARPLLEPLSTAIHHVGQEPGEAQFVKLINQLLVGIHLAASAEAMAMCAAGGVDPRQAYEIFTSGLGRSEIFATRVQTVLDGTLRTGGSLQINLKDIPLALEAARELGVPAFTGAAAFQLVQLSRAMGRGDQDDAALIAMLMELAAR